MPGPDGFQVFTAVAGVGVEVVITLGIRATSYSRELAS